MSSDSNTTLSDDSINYNTNLNKTRKKREELSINSLKNIKKENVSTIIIFN
jgi:hypothetical protein